MTPISQRRTGGAHTGRAAQSSGQDPEACPHGQLPQGGAVASRRQTQQQPLAFEATENRERTTDSRVALFSFKHAFGPYLR